MDDSCAFLLTLPQNSGPSGPPGRTIARPPGADRRRHARTLAFALSAVLHILVLGLLAWARLSTPPLAPPELIAVEFVEIAGVRGGGGTGAMPPAVTPKPPTAAAARTSHAANQTASRAARPSDLAQGASQQSASPSAETPPRGMPGLPGGTPDGGPGSGTGGGTGTGDGQAPGEGTGQGGSAVDRMPAPVRMVKPVYPMAARRRGIGGQVLLRLFVDAAGNVREVRVQSATPPGVFDEQAVEAARKWRFRPGAVHGVSVGMWMTLPVRFALDAQ